MEALKHTYRRNTSCRQSYRNVVLLCTLIDVKSAAGVTAGRSGICQWNPDLGGCSSTSDFYRSELCELCVSLFNLRLLAICICS